MVKLLKLSLIFCCTCVGLTGCTPEIQEFIDPIPVVSPGEAISTTGFTATWKPLLGANGYLLEIATSASFEEEELIAESPIEVQDTAYSVNKLKVAHTYYYRLAANLSTGEQTRHSDIIQVTTLGMPAPLAIDPTNIGPTHFTAHWQKITEAKAYEIEIGTDIDFANSSSLRRIVTEDTFVVVNENLGVNNDYFYRVVAKNDDVVSSYSNTVHLTTTQLTRPIIIGNLDSTQTQFTFQWESVTGAVDYTVEITTDPLFLDNGAFIVKNEAVEENEFTIQNLNANTVYYYRIQANNEKSSSEYSEKGKVTTLPLTAPIASAGSEIQRNEFRANWQSVTSAESYTLDVATDPYFTQFVDGYNALSLTDTSVLVTGVKQDTEYFYRVTAVGLNTSSIPSNTIQASTPFLTTPVAYEASDLGSTSLTATWTPVLEAETYELEVSTDPDFSVEVISVVSIADTSYQIQSLDSDQTYYFRIRAKEGVNYSSYSNIVSQHLVSIDSPTNLSVANLTYNSFNAIWDIVEDASYYSVDVATDDQFNNMLPDYSGESVNSTSILIEGLSTNTTYYLRVRAFNNYTNSAYSDTLLVTTPAVDSPTAQQPLSKSAYSIYGSWSLVPDATSYLVDVSTEADFSSFLSGYESLSVEGTSLAIDNLAPATTYHYRVRAVVGDNTSDYSNTLTVTTNSIPVPDVPGTVEAENYFQHLGIERIESATASNGYYLGSIHQGDSVGYQLNVSSIKSYTVGFRVANASGSTKYILVKDGDTLLKLVAIPETGDWDTWTTVTTTINSFAVGTQNIRIEFSGGSNELMRLDWINIAD